MTLNVFLFIFGFILLLKGADILTDAGTLIARRLKVSEFIIGVLIVGIGTSIPELIIAVFSTLEGNSSIGIGTVVGSNTLNILLILGVSALITPLILTKSQVWRHLPLNIFAVAIVGLMVRFGARLENGAIGISRIEGFILLALFFGWIYYLYYLYLLGEDRSDFTDMKPTTPHAHEHSSLPITVVAGLIGIIIGGEWVTDGAVALARFFGVKEAVTLWRWVI
jgi:cation:H+ antiporter